MFNMESILMMKLLGIDLGSSSKDSGLSARVDSLEKQMSDIRSDIKENAKAISDLVLVSQRLSGYRGNNGNNGNNNGGQKP